MADFYIDFDNGNDGWAGNLANPWATLDQFCENARAPGDRAIVRRGMTQVVASDLVPISDGTIVNPIIMEADYDNANWPVGGQDFVNSAQTYTLAFGLKAVLASANSDFVVAEWMYESTEDNREFSYEVAGVQNTQNGTDDGADNTKLIDTGEFGATVVGTYVQNTTQATDGYVSQLINVNTVEVTEDGRPSGSGGTVVQFANGDNWTMPAQIVLFLPYKGNIAAAGRTLVRMPYASRWNTAAGDFQLTFSAADFWKIQGLHIRGTDANGQIYLASSAGIFIKDCIVEGNGAADIGWYYGGICHATIRKCRSYNNSAGLSMNTTAHLFYVYDSLIDGNNVAGSYGMFLRYFYAPWFYEVEFRNHATGDIYFRSTETYDLPIAHLRDCLFSSTTEFDRVDLQHWNSAYVEDHDQIVGDNRQYTGFSVDEATPIIQSETVTVRVGGGDTSIRCTPSTELAATWELSKVLLFEYPIYQAVAAKTYTVYFLLPAANFTIAPLATELWIELEAWGGNNHRKITKSVGVIIADGTWRTLTVTVTPNQAGVAYLRGYYCKTKEAVVSNIFYTDTKIGVA